MERLVLNLKRDRNKQQTVEPKVNLDETTEIEPVRLVNNSKTTQQNI